jgi:hypothetical protein
MSDTLTKDDIRLLSKPFLYSDHEFTRGYVYITESAITARLDDVDPAWAFELQHVTVRDRQGVARARLTVKGVSRENMGMQAIEYDKSGEREMGEAEKGAATDALKRCARLFGIGRYLLNAPKEGEFKAWLIEQQKEWKDRNGTSEPSPAPQRIAEVPKPTIVPQAVVITDESQLDKVFGYADWDALLASGKDIMTFDEIVRKSANGKEYYRLTNTQQGSGASTWSTTTLRLLGINYGDLTSNKKVRLPQPVSAPILVKGDFTNINDELVKTYLGAAEKATA